MKRRGYWKQSKPGWWESEWTRCGSVHETRYYFTPLLPICNDLIQKSTPYVAVPLYVKLPLLYCLTILFFPTPGKSPPYKHNLKQVIVFYFHSNGWYHNFKVYASSSGACNSVTSNMKAEEGKKMWQTSRSYKNIQCFKLGTQTILEMHIFFIDNYWLLKLLTWFYFTIYLFHISNKSIICTSPLAYQYFKLKWEKSEVVKHFSHSFLVYRLTCT